MPAESPDVAWERLEGVLARVERPARYIDSEWGAIRGRDGAYRAALAYPDTYEIGQANQALAILYQRLNAEEGFAAERVYVPWVDMAAEMRKERIPLFSLESLAPIAGFDLLGITLPYELTYTNVLELLDLCEVPLRAAERTDDHPLVVGGGPCAYNPEPMAPFFDALLIGEGEEAVLDIVRTHREAREEGRERAEVLERLATIPGVYVPSLYDVVSDGAPMNARPPAPDTVVKRAVTDLGEYRPPVCGVVPYMDVVHDRVAIEVLRGCTRGCRFCQAGMVYRPVRERVADDIVREVMEGLACTGYDEVSLTSLSTTDHSQLEEVVRRLTSRLESTGVSVSLPSLRVDAFSVGMARLLAAGGKLPGLTLAPEAGTQRLRDVINKNVTEDDLIDAVSRAFAAGWRRVKLYFMIGLPTETDADIVGIGELVRGVLSAAREAAGPDRGSVRVAVSVSTFVPKAHTPFQWLGQVPLDEILRRQQVLRDAVPRKGVDLSWHDADVSLLEAAMARGGREVASAIEAAWRSGARFDAWTERFDLTLWREAFASAGLDASSIAEREFGEEDVLPWAHISCGVSPDYLWREYERAVSATPTPDCSFDRCTGCEVCRALGIDLVVGGERRGAQ